MDFLAPYHPQITHAPIVLLVFALLFDVIGRLTDLAWWRKAAFALLVFGALGGVAAVLSGLPSGELAEKYSVPEQAVDAHEEMALLTLWVASAALIARILEAVMRRGRGLWSALALVLLAGAVGLVAVTAHRGGKLVFEHGADVRVHGVLVSGPERPPERGEH